VEKKSTVVAPPTADKELSRTVDTVETATTMKTTYDELMQALSKLEADEPLPVTSRGGPEWRESAIFCFVLSVSVSIVGNHHKCTQ